MNTRSQYFSLFKFLVLTGFLVSFSAEIFGNHLDVAEAGEEEKREQREEVEEREGEEDKFEDNEWDVKHSNDLAHGYALAEYVATHSAGPALRGQKLYLLYSSLVFYH